MIVNNNIFKKFPEIELFEFPEKHDERGSFVKTFSREDFPPNSFNFDEIYYSISKKNVIRGIHYQIKPIGLEKLVTCIEGEIKDFVIDLRKESKTYLNFETIKLTKNMGIFVPYGFGHGFSALSDNTKVLYCQEGKYSPQYEGGINPLSIDVDWEVETPILSERDSQLPSIDSYKPEL